MNRSIIENEMCLPHGETETQMRPITIGTLAILERLGNPLVGTLIGVGNAQFTDSVENLLELFYIHSVDDSQLYSIVDALYTDPDSVKKDAVLWGKDMSVDEIADNLNKLLHQQGLIQGSMVETVKNKARKSPKKV